MVGDNRPSPHRVTRDDERLTARIHSPPPTHARSRPNVDDDDDDDDIIADLHRDATGATRLHRESNHRETVDGGDEVSGRIVHESHRKRIR